MERQQAMNQKLFPLILFILLLGLVLPVNAAVLDTSDADLIVYYKLNGDSCDSSGYGYHASRYIGTLGDAAKYRDATHFRNSVKEAKYGSSYRWGDTGGGGGQSVGFEIPNDISVILDGAGGAVDPPDAGTIVSWLRLWDPRPSTQNKYRYISGIEGGAGGAGSNRERFHFYFSNYNNRLSVGMGNQHSMETEIVDLLLDTWYHVALAFEADTVTSTTGEYWVYLNGAPLPDGSVRTEAVFTGTNYRSFDTLQGWANEGRGGSLGNTGHGSARQEAMRGWIDEWAIYKRALTRTEIAAIADTDPNAAFNLEPLDGNVQIQPDTNVIWIAGNDANTHEVYFGTSFDDVNDGTGASGTTALEYDPAGAGFLLLDTKYYCYPD